ncbi:hypothetical protein HU200_008999 [Digitaria exilis]|uniref:Calmodulin-binding domain-containing protein n=1 Tax=Digitaria exilis TaxID=1010633 RepID=A0A835FKU1_9POAL|nr:hypothetical protein HU200_008999 [Digitaria exilis]
MATSRREPQPNARGNRGARNMSPGIKPSESDQGLRRARSVPTSPDRRLSPSPASSSSNTSRPSSSFNARTTSSRSTSGSGSSSTHGKTLHSASSLAGAKQANTMRRKVEKPGATSVWPAALATPNTSSKDITRTAKSLSTVQKSNLSTGPGTEKMATSSVKLKTQKSKVGPLGAGKAQAVSSTRDPGSIAKRRTGVENSLSIQRTKSVPARQIETPKIEEQDVELLMEFDETESISTSSIEEHLQERLPDPVDLQSGDINSKPSSSHAGGILEVKREGKDNEDLNAGDNSDVGINSDINILKEATGKTELKEAVEETELKEEVSATEPREYVDETKLNEAFNEAELNETIDETKLKEADCETASKEAACETELKDDVAEPKLIVQEEDKSKDEKITLPAKTMELAQRWRKDDGKKNEATEDSRSKSIQERKNKVMALVGRFETAMSGRE